jgi:hypothetical protein
MHGVGVNVAYGTPTIPAVAGLPAIVGVGSETKIEKGCNIGIDQSLLEAVMIILP